MWVGTLIKIACEELTAWKTELLLKVCPSGDPLLRGYCSACLDTTFVFAVNTEENQRLMQQAFNIHVQEVHILLDLAGCRAVLKSAPAANASPYGNAETKRAEE